MALEDLSKKDSSKASPKKKRKSPAKKKKEVKIAVGDDDDGETETEDETTVKKKRVTEMLSCIAFEPERKRYDGPITEDRLDDLSRAFMLYQRKYTDIRIRNNRWSSRWANTSIKNYKDTPAAHGNMLVLVLGDNGFDVEEILGSDKVPLTALVGHYHTAIFDPETKDRVDIFLNENRKISKDGDDSSNYAATTTTSSSSSSGSSSSSSSNNSVGEVKAVPKKKKEEKEKEKEKEEDETPDYEVDEKEDGKPTTTTAAAATTISDTQDEPPNMLD